jgi:nucleoside-diphosphate-sugar epimerase
MVNVACGAATTLNQVVGLLGEITGKKIPVTYEPSRVGDVKHSLADITEAKTRLGYKGDISFREGLERTVKWYAAKK